MVRWEQIIALLLSNENNTDRFDVNSDDEILCKTEDDACCIADFIEALGFDVIHVSENEDAKIWRYEVYPD